MQHNLRALFLLLTLVCGQAVGRSGPAPENPEAAPTPRITYVLAMPRPETHYFEVEMRLSGHVAATNARKNGYVDVKLPVWTPGSYLIREYAKNLDAVTANAGGQPVRVEKITKNRWRVFSGADDLRIRYRAYAFEVSVRTSFLDADYGYVQPASLFMYHDALKNVPHRVDVQPYRNWRTSVALPVVAGSPAPGQTATFEAANYDLLVDSPIQLGPHTEFRFTASGVPHRVAMAGLRSIGPVPFDSVRLARDYQRVCEAATSVVGEHPCSEYLFIVQHLAQGGGGLEHLNSTTLQASRNAYATEAGYKGFFTLVAHEYFHLWNVKRIRPIALGPFNYEEENYTRALWEAEGFTSFYEDNILRRVGMHTPEQYLGILASDINGIENQPGNRVQAVADASFDAWIKYYRPNENSANTGIPYYTKGAVLANLLNLAILDGSNGTKTLDDVLRFLYQEYFKKQQRGFTDDELKRALEAAAGRNLDDFYARYVNGTDAIDYAPFFAPAGLRLVNVAPQTQDGFLGATTSVNAGGRLTVTSVRRGSAAEAGGLNVGDELLAVDSVRIGDDLSRLLAGRKAGDTVRFIVNRAGLLRELPITLSVNPLVAYRLEAVPNMTERQRMLYNKMLFIR